MVLAHLSPDPQVFWPSTQISPHFSGSGGLVGVSVGAVSQVQLTELGHSGLIQRISIASQLGVLPSQATFLQIFPPPQDSPSDPCGQVALQLKSEGMREGFLQQVIVSELLLPPPSPTAPTMTGLGQRWVRLSYGVVPSGQIGLGELGDFVTMESPVLGTRGPGSPLVPLFTLPTSVGL